MGLFDFLKGRGGGGDGGGGEKALLRHAERVVDKRALPPDRDASIKYLVQLDTPEAWRALLPRFGVYTDSGIMDREEKQFIYEHAVLSPETALEPVKEYLRKAASATWPIKMLKEMLPADEYVTELLDVLKGFDTEYEKNPERKIQVIAALEEVTDPRVGELVRRFLEDVNEEVRFHAVRTLLAQKDEDAAPALAKLYPAEESARIRDAVAEGLAEQGWAIPAGDKRTALAAALAKGGRYTVDNAGKVVKK